MRILYEEHHCQCNNPFEIIRLLAHPCSLRVITRRTPRSSVEGGICMRLSFGFFLFIPSASLYDVGDLSFYVIMPFCPVELAILLLNLYHDVSFEKCISRPGQ